MHTKWLLVCIYDTRIYGRTQQYSRGVPATYVRVCLKCFAVMIDYHLSMCVAEVYSIHIVFQWLMCVYRSSIMVPTVLCVWWWGRGKKRVNFFVLDFEPWSKQQLKALCLFVRPSVRPFVSIALLGWLRKHFCCYGKSDELNNNNANCTQECK